VVVAPLAIAMQIPEPDRRESVVATVEQAVLELVEPAPIHCLPTLRATRHIVRAGARQYQLGHNTVSFQ
jgi:hypothetical protein